MKSNFRNAAAALVVALTVTSAAALVTSRATHVGQAAQMQKIEVVAPADVSTVGAALSSSAGDDPSQPETATGLDLKGAPRRFPTSEIPDWDSTLVH